MAICFQVSAYEGQLFHCEPRMNADEGGGPVCRGLIRVHPRPSAVCGSCLPKKKSRKTPDKRCRGHAFGRVLTNNLSVCVQDKKSRRAGNPAFSQTGRIPNCRKKPGFPPQSFSLSCTQFVTKIVAIRKMVTICNFPIQLQTWDKTAYHVRIKLR